MKKRNATPGKCNNKNIKKTAPQTLELEPLLLIKKVEKQCPSIWQFVDDCPNMLNTFNFLWKFDSGRVAQLSDFPEYCFLPSLCLSAASKCQPIDGYSDEKEGYFLCLAAWRRTKGIYDIDNDLAMDITASQLNAAPVDSLIRLPEYCVYIKSHVIAQQSLSLIHTNKRGLALSLLVNLTQGFFANIDYDFEKQKPILKIIFQYEVVVSNGIRSESSPYLMNVPIEVSGDVFEFKISDISARYFQQTLFPDCAEEMPFVNDLETIRSKLHSIVLPMFKLVVYLCARNADIRTDTSPTSPKRKRTNRGLKSAPTSQPTVWKVGYHIGSQLRRIRAAQSTSSSMPGSVTGRKLRPHTRTGHWHTYRVGKGRTDKVTLYILPIIVNSHVGVPLPTIHNIAA